MRVMLEPRPDVGHLEAVRKALRQARLEPPSTPEQYRSAWRRAALAGEDADDGDPGYALPRSNRGATRA